MKNLRQWRTMICDDITVPGSNPEAETFPRGTASLNNFYYYFSGPYFIYWEPLKFIHQVYFGHLKSQYSARDWSSQGSLDLML